QNIVLHTNGFKNVITLADGRKLMDILKKQDMGIILLDLNMPLVEGEKLLKLVKENFPAIPVIVVTGDAKLEIAVKCMKMGAYDYLVKPVNPDDLIKVINHAFEFKQIQEENRLLKKSLFVDSLKNPEVFSEIVTQNKMMQSIFKYIEAVAPSPQPVLITGETGVGKELVAKTIHKLSTRKGKFIAVNVAGLDDNMVSDTLFGHVKGAFTSAEGERKGFVEKAKKGTLFLDEIGDLPLQSQVKLLRLIQEKEYFALGSDEAESCDVKVIAATHQDLENLQKQGKFRNDLYYRLNIHQIQIPPLRERLDDLPLLVEYFVEKAAETLKKKKPSLPKKLFSLLSSYSFPGNVRELESIIYDAISLNKAKVLSLETVKSCLDKKNGHSFKKESVEKSSPKFSIFFSEDLPTIKQTTDILLKEALKKTNGNQRVAAKILGISQQALSKRLKQKKQS
ncbi:sigma-54-dependent transcriptional regulator, partial [Candidatus Auribacterota bacterium]